MANLELEETPDESGEGGMQEGENFGMEEIGSQTGGIRVRLGNVYYQNDRVVPLDEYEEEVDGDDSEDEGDEDTDAEDGDDEDDALLQGWNPGARTLRSYRNCDLGATREDKKFKRDLKLKQAPPSKQV